MPHARVERRSRPTPTHLRLVRVARGESADELIAAAQHAERQGDHGAARRCYERALYALPTGQPSRASGILRWIGRTYQAEANPDAALDCLEAAIAVAEAAYDDASAGHAINIEATVFFQQGALDDAERLFLSARERAQLGGERKLAAMTAQNLGVIANIRGDLPKALRFYESSLVDYRALGLARDVAVALNNLGMLHTDQQRWDAAESAYDEAAQISQVIGDLGVGTLVEVNRAEMWIARGEFAPAREACERAMALMRETKDDSASGEAHKLLGVITREEGDLSAAEAHFAAAEAAASHRKNLLLSAETARERADLHRRQGRNRDTLQCLNRAHRLFAELRAQRDLADIDRRTWRLEGDFLDVVRRWGESIESKDRYTQGHCERVADLACAIAAKTGMDRQTLFWFRIGALLHDVGKLMIPSEVLNKPGRLNEEEWELMRQHPTAGAEMLQEIEFPWDVRPIVESHHERWDGAGYPHGLAGEAIPLTARILCIADVYDALTSERSYKRALSHDVAMDILRRDIGKAFDPHVFELFEQVTTDGPLVSKAPMRIDAEPRRVMKSPSGLSTPHPDDLTGLPLRRAFFQFTTETLAARYVERRPSALLVVDVDGFKEVNDRFGHQRGDALLRAIAETLRTNVRPCDFVARYGGDEFVVLLPDLDAPSAVEIAERLRIAVEQFASTDAEGAKIGNVSLSIGVAEAPTHGNNVEALFAAGDAALYSAKRAGRNRVHVAESETRPPARAQIGLDHFVGRVREVRRLAQLLDAAAHGETRVVVLRGEAGIGKSRLLGQLAPEVRLRGGAVVVGQCAQADSSPPYAPWSDAIASLDRLNLLPRRAWPELSRLVPSLAGDMDGTSQAPSSKYSLFDEITECLRSAATEHPLLVVLDDVQWADEATWDALEHLVLQLSSVGVLFCLTLRDEDVTADVESRLARLQNDDRVHELRLARLGTEDVADWISAILDNAEVSAPLAAALSAHTEGNPLLIVQALQALLDEGLLHRDDGQWRCATLATLAESLPVSQIIQRRLGRLTAKARLALTTAAVGGRVFDLDFLVGTGVMPEADLLDVIDEALEAAVLEPAGRRDGSQFAFTHASLAEALRQSASERRLRRAHARVALALEVNDPSAVAEIAFHYDRAGDSDKALPFALLAARHAESVYALHEADAAYGIALRHSRTVDELRVVRARRAEVAEAAGRFADAAVTVDELLASLPESASDAEMVPLLRMRERLRSRLGRPPRATLHACGALLRRARTAALRDEVVSLLTMISQLHSRLGELTEAESSARECALLADGSGSEHLRAEALLRLATTLVERKSREARMLHERALALFVKLDDRRGQARCLVNLGIARTRDGDLAGAAAAYEEALVIGQAIHAPDLAGLAALNAGVLASQTGQRARARESLDQSLRLFTAVRHEGHRLAALYNLAHLAREEGDHADAVSRYTEVARLAQTIGQDDVVIGAHAGLGLCQLALGDAPTARESAARARSSLVAHGDDDWWFQGRELYDALGTRLAFAAGESNRGTAMLRQAIASAHARDEYGELWLAAECVPLLMGVAPDAPALAARHAARAAALGYDPLARRLQSTADSRVAI
jgi:diguanylate cyclase (GGDEF)-like protein/putative nucleotidyltransferase with HDIG domain